MATYMIWLLLAVGYIYTASANESVVSKKSTTNPRKHDEITDLKTAASTYYSNGIGPLANSGYGVTGHGTLDNKRFPPPNAYNNFNRYDDNNEISRQGYTGTFDQYRENSPHAGYPEYNNLAYKPFHSNFGRLPYSGNGGYGGYGGNGGLGSYLGYNNPYYHGANHLGYGYYNKPGLSSIYNSGITPSLVTGYRGYSRK